jgi:hypothetical protein
MNLKQFYTGRAIGFAVILAIVVCVFAIWRLQPTSAQYPTTLTADQVIVADAHPSSPAPAGFHALKDIQLNVTFNAPVNWKPLYLPEGDGHASIVSPDFSNPLADMTGAYLHYYFQSPPDQFIGRPDAYLALLKQGSTWTQMSLDGHIAYLAKPAKGYDMVVSEFSDDSFFTVAFDDTTGTYGAVFNEFLRSFHAQ